MSPINTQDDENGSSITLAIILLVVGISSTLGLFIYLALNANYAKRKFRWPNLKYKNKKDVSADAEADYLINGMYL